MKLLRAAVVLSFVTCFAATASPSLGPVNADKSSDLIAELENPLERAAALEKVKGLGRKTPAKVRTYLLQQVGASDKRTAMEAMEAVVAVGKPMTKPLKTVLETGEYKGSLVPAFLAARAALRITPTGERVIVPFLEAHPLTADVAAEIGEHAEPAAALQILVSKGAEEASRPIVLEELRRLRDRNAFEKVEGATDVVKLASKGFDAPTPQLLLDAAIRVDPEGDLERMRTWVTSGDPVLSESAILSMGGVGEPFMELAPLLAPHVVSDSPSVRRAAHWTLRRWAAPDAPESSMEAGAPAQRGAKELSEQEREELRLFEDLRGADSSSVIAVEHWRFAPRWLNALRSTLSDPTFATESSGWQQEYLPDAIEELKPTLVTALSSEDPTLSTPAGLTLIKWNVRSREVLLWAASAVGSAAEIDSESPVWSLLLRESDSRWVKQKASAESFTLALKKEATEVPTLKLLLGMDNSMSRMILVKHFSSSNAGRPWQAAHYRTAHQLMVLYPENRPKLLSGLGQRFLSGDSLVAPLLVLGGESAHPILARALESSNLNLRMVALATIMEQDAKARSMLSEVQQMRETEPAAVEFRKETLKGITDLAKKKK